MARSSTKTFYGQKNGERNQTHKTRRQVVKEFVAEWVGKAEKDVIKETLIGNHSRSVGSHKIFVQP